MPRTKRLILPNIAMHIMCRGNNKQNIFNSDSDKLHYYFLIRGLKQENKVAIFHYCLMNNHVHLLVWLPPESNISKFMKQLSLSYFHYYNKTYGYVGHLLQGRFKSRIVDTDAYLLQCGKYIELNPVRGSLVRTPDAYQFSSYNHYAKGYADTIITDSPLYLDLADSTEKRRKEYARLLIDEDLMNTNPPGGKRPLGGEPSPKISLEK